ncbi:MAG TPA: 4-(cytidine 5'-diphospho)-2-C-methyl-D-erythritol kinase, partial [Hanamia sp.]|nr:4-(cytidine 5'-diphospho)-2-C-methyl-D-erythritol kinase [Hanamia sp.]
IVTSENKTEFKNTGISGGDITNNLCLKAFYLLKKEYPHLPEIKMHLHKTIPVGSGLGGGSADAAFTLLLLNQKYDLNIPFDNLLGYASQLGSDCSFFILNSPCFASGVGEKMEEINLSLSSYKILLINPGIHISTKELFSKITPTTPQKSIKEIIRQPTETWKNDLKNDFEPIVFSKYEEIKKLKEDLYKLNAVYASMTGTGSTVFGIFNKKDKVDINLENNFFYKWIDLE